MKKYLLAVLVCLTLTIMAFCDDEYIWSQRVGDMTFFSNGGSAQHVGDMTFYHFPNVAPYPSNNDFSKGFLNGLSSELNFYNDLDFAQLRTLRELNQQVYIKQIKDDIEWIDTYIYENFLKNKTPEQVWNTNNRITARKFILRMGEQTPIASRWYFDGLSENSKQDFLQWIDSSYMTFDGRLFEPKNRIPIQPQTNKAQKYKITILKKEDKK